MKPITMLFAVAVIAMFAGCGGSDPSYPGAEDREYSIVPSYMAGSTWYNAPLDPAVSGYVVHAGIPGKWNFGVIAGEKVGETKPCGGIDFEITVIRSLDGTVVLQDADGYWTLTEGYYVVKAVGNGVRLECGIHAYTAFGRG